ncbi:unnamed protein product [Rhizophagus irregularis]|nr:unnamed protein product [Rhizophagus irregularis]CAB5394664.1 unnamed protein product [Rhizophagus irregularis]
MSKPTVFCSCYKCVHYDEHSLGRYVSESTKRRHQKIEKDYLADENSSDIEEIQQHFEHDDKLDYELRKYDNDQNYDNFDSFGEEASYQNCSADEGSIKNPYYEKEEYSLSSSSSLENHESSGNSDNSIQDDIASDSDSVNNHEVSDINLLFDDESSPSHSDPSNDQINDDENIGHTLEYDTSAEISEMILEEGVNPV